MGFLSSSKSKRTTTITNDNRAIGRAENAINGDGNSVSIVDGGAIKLAGELAKTNSKNQRAMFENTTEFASEAFKRGSAMSNNALEAMGNLSRRSTDSMAKLFDSFGDRNEETLITSLDAIKDNNKRVYEVISDVTTSSSDKGLKAVKMTALALIAGFVVLGALRK